MGRSFHITDHEKAVVREHYLTGGVRKCMEVLGCSKRRAYCAWLAAKRDMAKEGKLVDGKPPRRCQRKGLDMRDKIRELYPQLGLALTCKELGLGEKVVLRIAREEDLVGKSRPGPKLEVYVPGSTRSDDPAVNSFWEKWDARHA